uniref:Metaxin glutathione S-transferase domain-containing protein n=1 Tax=Hanusia phi TaxID=3032 RepID=A0A7S0NEQ5_9CRYP
MYKKADACYSALSSFLGDQLFFFGSSPSSLDAMVFGHLAPHLYAPMVEARLKKQLRKYQNLCNYVDRVRKGYMSMPRIPPADPADLEATDAANANPKSAKSQLSPQDKAVRRRTRDFIALGVVVTVAFLLFTNVIDVETDEVQGE